MNDEQIAQFENKIAQDHTFSTKFGEHIDTFLNRQGVDTNAVEYK